MATTSQKSSSDGDHFYTREGVPAYGAGIREVREQGYLPSPSTILKVLNKPGILRWYSKMVAEMAIDIAGDLTGIDRDDAVQKVLDATKEKSREPMELGTRIHNSAESILIGRNPAQGDPYSMGIKKFCDANIIRTRWVENTVKYISPEICYAGRVDALVEHQQVGLAVLDWKSSSIKRRSKRENKPQPIFYDPYIMQLACYSKAISGSPQPISVAINTEAGYEGECVEKVWTDLEWARGWRMFVLAYRLWCEDRKYSPHKFCSCEEDAA